MKVLSLFSGIGAFESALNNLNIDYEIVNYCEIDKYASKSYSAIHNIPEEKNLWDITKIDIEKLPNDEIDLITYGFPCQDISVAGKQKGMFNTDGTLTRSGLFFEALKVIEHCKPKIAIAENVKNLTSKKFATQFETVLNSLEDAGYNNYWKVLNAKDYGIPQNRERVFIVSIKKDIDMGNFEFPKPFELKLRLKDFLDDEVDEKYFLSGVQVDRMKTATFSQNKYEHRCTNENGISPTLCARDYKDPKCVELKTKKQELCDYLIKNNKVKELDVIKHSYSTSRMNDWETRNVERNNESPTLDTRCDCLGVVVNQPPLRIRKYTPKECYRLMGFSDEEFERVEKLNSNSQLYKQAGNSIVVDVLKYIFMELKKACLI